MRSEEHFKVIEEFFIVNFSKEKHLLRNYKFVRVDMEVLSFIKAIVLVRVTYKDFTVVLINEFVGVFNE